MSTDAQLAQQAWAEFSATTDSYPTYLRKGKPAASHWTRGKAILDRIGLVVPPSSSDLYWLPSSYLNRRIPLNPALHLQSDAWIKMIADKAPAGIWNNGQTYPGQTEPGQGSPTIYDKSKATTTKTLILAYATQFVPQVFTFEWNPVWKPGPTGDTQLAIVDPVTGEGIEFQGFEALGDGGSGHAHSAATFNVRTQDGSAVYGNRVGNAPLLAGINRPIDYVGKEILHAGRCALEVCSNRVVWPALVSDGRTVGGPPMGSHLALPRSVDLTQFGLDKWQTMHAVQLQEFGHFASDAGGGYSLSLQSVADGVTKYPALIDHLPVELIRQMVVLA